MMKLEEIKQYKVGSQIFETKEEAEAYLKEQEIAAIRQGVLDDGFPLVPTIYYENVVSIDDRGHLQTKARWLTLDEAIDAMDDFADYFRDKGTGSIYKVTVSLGQSPFTKGNVSVIREEVFKK